MEIQAAQELEGQALFRQTQQMRQEMLDQLPSVPRRSQPAGGGPAKAPLPPPARAATPFSASPL